MGVHAQSERGVDPDHAVLADRPSVRAHQKALLLQAIEIAPNRIARHVEQRHEFGHGRLAALLQQVEQTFLTYGGKRAGAAMDRGLLGHGRVV